MGGGAVPARSSEVLPGRLSLSQGLCLLWSLPLGFGLVTLTDPDVMVCSVSEPAVCCKLITCAALLHRCQGLLKRGLLTLLSQGRRSVRLPSPGPREAMVDPEGQWWGQGLCGLTDPRAPMYLSQREWSCDSSYFCF